MCVFFLIWLLGLFVTAAAGLVVVPSLAIAAAAAEVASAYLPCQLKQGQRVGRSRRRWLKETRVEKRGAIALSLICIYATHTANE